MKAQAPGKLILSGEHSVVYGAPALAMAVQERVEVSFTPAPCSEQLTFLSPVFAETSIALSSLSGWRMQLDQAYQQFLDGQLSMSEVLGQPIELLFYILSLYPPTGGCFTLNSSIPTGAGLGSSAAVIAAMLQCTPARLLERCAFMQQVRFCERLQHGRGSLLDAATVTFGGAVKVQNDRVSAVSLPLGSGWCRMDTGRPDCSTGDVVEQVRLRYAESHIWNEFADLTDQIEQNWLRVDKVIGLIRDNHRLLQQIGVVPDRVAALIQQIENLGGAAKVSGAGAHRGDQAGQVLVFLPEDVSINTCEAVTGIRPVVLQQSARGAWCADD
ncbi:mevalonate kinase [Pontibacter sp. JAM-7]|uniref:mevalonate kinase family protein n=1 Tax=Pontibacter sp. JAM-7 TaxID=3366581 RepID=UPI003AF69E25